MPDLSAIRSDLEAEHRSLDRAVASLGGGEWDTPTPAEGWTIRDQISHLAFFDEQATLAVSDVEAFSRTLAEIARDIGLFESRSIDKGRAMEPKDVLAWWRTARTEMLSAFENLDPDMRINWYGPPMKPASFISARIMETWAHGQDVFDALGITRDATTNLKHVAHLGVIARNWSYSANGMEAPSDEIRVELRGPRGEVWSWGPADATQRVRGDAYDFCLVVTRRRHPDDTDLVVEGAAASEWMAIAQAYAGPPGAGRKPGQFPKRSLW